MVDWVEYHEAVFNQETGGDPLVRAVWWFLDRRQYVDFVEVDVDLVDVAQAIL